MEGHLAGIWRPQPHSRGCGRIAEQSREVRIRAVSAESTVFPYSMNQHVSVCFATFMCSKTRPHLECVSIQSLRKTRKRLESGSGVRDEGDGRNGAGSLPCCELDTFRLARLVLEGACEL